MTLRDRLRRWWSPAPWADDHPAERIRRYGDERPLSEKERAERKERDFFDEATKVDGYTIGGRAIDPNDEFRR